MPPKPRFPRDAIVEAAYQVGRRDGLAAVTARSVAKELESSTAPVTGSFDSMQELVDAVVARMLDHLLETIDEVDGPDPLRAAAFAFARFVTHERRSYEGVFLVPHDPAPDFVGLRRRFSRGLAGSQRFGHLSPRGRDALAWRVGVIAHGICIEIWSGRWDKTDDRSLRRLVNDLVEPVIAAAL